MIDVLRFIAEFIGWWFISGIPLMITWVLVMRYMPPDDWNFPDESRPSQD